jgi:hypothetical protein
MTSATPHRSLIKQLAPPPNFSVKGFPKKRIEAGKIFFRQHRASHNPWYFSSSDGRFNRESPRGRLYLASTLRAAAMEQIGPDNARQSFVTSGEVEGRVVSQLKLQDTVRVAFCTSIRATKWRIVVNELAVIPDYSVTRAWAKLFDDSGFDGIWSTIRFSIPQARSLVIFGDEGERSWPIMTSRSLRAICADLDVQVVDPPSSSSLTIIRPKSW